MILSLPFIIASVMILVFIGGLVFAWLDQKRRREEMAVFAAAIGFGFDPHRDTGHDEQYAQFDIFRRGHSRAAYNTLHGSVNLLGQTCPVRLGDFTYQVTSGSGKNRRTVTYRFSYLIAHHPLGRLPALLVRPEGVFDKLAGAFGFDDIDFESVDFSKRFYVKSEDKRFAYDVIDPRMMEFLLASQPVMIDLEAGCCCLSDGRSRWTPEQFKAMLAWIAKFFEHWPRHVIDDPARYAA